jgi:DNA helicase-2/ATP-dependent DNA helicase PcrA
MSFEERYQKLNPAQRQAVDTIDGPVMVVAGPGTGKTELLSMRVANILKQTDELPENILCLTFTDAGVIAMKKRLREIIGRDAYKVPVMTFHSFGTDIMNQYPEHFYSGASFRPADELTQLRIINDILDKLPYDDPLKAKMNGEYTSVKNIISAIGDVKGAGLTDEQFSLLLDTTESTVNKVEQLIVEAIGDGMRGKAPIARFEALLEKLRGIDEPKPLENFSTLIKLLTSTLEDAVDEAKALDKAKPLTEWKDELVEKDAAKNIVMKARKQLRKLRALNVVYVEYLNQMQTGELYDFNDMILQVVKAIETQNDLRYDLQEKYHYIMVDEFQDTNPAQMSIVNNLTNNPVVDDQPNILVVGDDDQAIYGFQGADIGNILQFEETYTQTTKIPLLENYRSVAPILETASQVIGQSDERIPGIDKNLEAKTTNTPANSEIVEFATPHEERKWIADSIRELLDGGEKPSEIAIIARKHKDLESLIGYLGDVDVAINYERKEDVLDDEIIKLVERIGAVVHAISTERHDHANSMLPELLGHPMWGIEPRTLWEISLSAYKDRQQWLEIIPNHESTQPIFEWLLATAGQALHLPLERMIDVIIGNSSLVESYTSPLKEYFFSDNERENNLAMYTIHLENLSSIRKKLREHHLSLKKPLLGDYLNFMQDNRTAKIKISAKRHIGAEETAVKLISGHGSKGLEFNHVFIVNATESQWGEKASGKSDSIKFPPHLRLKQNGNSYNERLRLFYVAMTRARRGLHISYANENDNGKDMLMAGFLAENSLPLRAVEHNESDENREQAAEKEWYEPILSIPEITIQQYLAPELATYKLSATHFTNFLDVTRGGPRKFLLNNMLHFPSAQSAAASFGNAIHNTMERIHTHMRAHGSLLSEEDIMAEFERQLDEYSFSDDERTHFLQKGHNILHVFLAERSDMFNPNQIAERNFSNQDVTLEDARL